MGTHPIFESDFDCLTESYPSDMFGAAWIIRDAIPNYLKSVPIPYNLADLRDMTLMEMAHATLFLGATGYSAYAVYQKCTVKPVAPRCNNSIQLEDEKVVHSYDIEDMADKEVYRRCWKSKSFPYCDGSHNAHNKKTGDNTGPLIIKKKSK